MLSNSYAPRLTFPNGLTAARIAAAPLLAMAVSLEPFGVPRWIAVLILLFAGTTDFLDGMFARLLRQVSPLGAILDPIADKIFIATALFLLAASGALQAPLLAPALLILWRELLITNLRGHMRAEGFELTVSGAARWKTALQFCAAGLLFAARVPASGSGFLFSAGGLLLWAAAVFTLYTGTDYLRGWLRTWK